MRVALSLIVALATLRSAASTSPGFGAYSYDGAGNITGIGGDRFVYDEFGRLRSATLVQGTTTHSQEFTYDRYGNIRKIVTAGEAAPAVPAVNEATNRIDLPGATTTMLGQYDGAGNLISYHGGVDRFTYDALNVMTESTVDTQRRLYLYTASNERIAILNMAGTTVASSSWTLRDASAKVLRRFERDAAGAWRWDEDYIYRGSQMLAAEVPGNTLHFHLDHLGTPRVITGNGGARIAAHTYYPFGRELTSAAQDNEAKKFTGHERDAVNLDYMHARSYLPWTGRFLSVDPLINRRVVAMPQGWNRYSYALNNPMRFTDPTGLDPTCHKVKDKDGKEQVICAETIDVKGKVPKTPTIRGSANSLFDLMRWAGGRLPRVSAADPSSARDLSNTPVMDQIREKYKESGCEDGRFYGDFQYGELATTPPFSTGQMVGSFGADVRGIGHGLVVVRAYNTWGLESATRFPGTSNRGNASVQQMLGGAPLQYPKSLLENRSNGPMGTATINYIWTEGSPCAQ